MRRGLIALLLAFGWLFSTPAHATPLVTGDRIQFSYTWGSVTRTFTDSVVTVTVTNDITNKIGYNGEVIDTYRITFGDQVIEVTEKHGPRDYNFLVSGSATITLEGIDRGFWAGFYGPVMVVSVSPIVQPEEPTTQSPEVATQSPTLSTPVLSESASVSPESESTVVTPQPEPLPSPEPSPTPPPTPEPKPIVKDESSANTLITAMDDYFYSWGIDFEYYSADPRVQEFVQNRAQRTMCFLAQNWVCAIDYNAAMGYSFRAVLKGFQEGNLYHQEVITNLPLVSQSPESTPEPSPTPTYQPEPTPEPTPSETPTASFPTQSPEPEPTRSPIVEVEPEPASESPAPTTSPTLPPIQPEPQLSQTIEPTPVQSSEAISEEPSTTTAEIVEVAEETFAGSLSAAVQAAVTQAVEAVGQLVEAFATAGLDMTPEQREKAQDVVVSTVIASQVAVGIRKIK